MSVLVDGIISSYTSSALCSGQGVDKGSDEFCGGWSVFLKQFLFKDDCLVVTGLL